MKKTLIFLISLYRVGISPLIHSVTGTTRACRYEISCSRYAVLAIEKHGAFKGSLYALKRVLSCHPFAKVSDYQV